METKSRWVVFAMSHQLSRWLQVSRRLSSLMTTGGNFVSGNFQCIPLKSTVHRACTPTVAFYSFSFYSRWNFLFYLLHVPGVMTDFVWYIHTSAARNHITVTLFSLSVYVFSAISAVLNASFKPFLQTAFRMPLYSANTLTLPCLSSDGTKMHLIYADHCAYIKCIFCLV